MKIPKALTIAGSDSGGGAGIQADLKTFAALKVHGTSALTSITAQNTKAVTAIQDVSPAVIRAQIDAVVADIGVDAAKTGMLHSSRIISTVAEAVRRHRFPTVVDPVMIAKSGVPLIKPAAIKTLTEELLPLATVLTPNAKEAEVLAAMKLHSVQDAKRAAKRIAGLGPKSVVVKGGHLKMGDRVTDLLYFEGGYTSFTAARINTRTTHGTGCSFSAAIAAHLAMGRGVVEAVRLAKELVTQAIKFGFHLGQGHGPVNPLAGLYREADMHRVWQSVRKGADLLEQAGEVALLIPESQTNLGMALVYAESPADVCAIPGRIVKVGQRVRASAAPEFGASQHVANTILATMKHDPEVRAAMNIRYSEEILVALRRMGLQTGYYDRRREPPKVKAKEGMTTTWGAEEAIKQLGRMPDIIYHMGDVGKEPMITILGRSAIDVAQRAIAASKAVRRFRAKSL